MKEIKFFCIIFCFFTTFFVSAANLLRETMQVATPIILAAEKFSGTKTALIISCDTEGATIFFTTDGSEPNSHSKKYTVPIEIYTTTTIKAFAQKKDFLASDVAVLTIVKEWQIGDYMGDPDREFTTESEADGGWFRSNGISEYSDEDSETECMRSGHISDSEYFGEYNESTMRTTVNGSGMVRFNWKSDCEYDEYYEWDHGEFRVDGNVVYRINGNNNWQEMTYRIDTDGEHELVWSYLKDDYQSDFNMSDCIWVNNFSWARDIVNDYWISFQPNGATVGESYIQQFTYDVPQVLQSPATPYYKGEFFTFLGWARTEDATEPEYLDGATVINVFERVNIFEKCTNYLYAVWKKEPHDFSDAVGLENLRLQSKENFGAPPWILDNAAANALEGTNCVVAVGCGKTQRMFVRVRERGYISFSWKTDYTGTDALFSVTTNAVESVSGVSNAGIATDAQPTTAWTQVNVNIESADVPELAWLVRLPTGKHLWVDQMRWHPGEVAPEPVDPDPPTPVDPDPPTPPAPEFVIRTSGGWVESNGVYTDTETNKSDPTKRGVPLIAELPGAGTLTWEWNADYDGGSSKCFAIETEDGPLPLFYYPNEDQWESGSFETDEPCSVIWYFADVNKSGAKMQVRNIVWTPSAEPSGNLPVNVISITGGKFSINVNLKAGKTYVIEATDSLNPQNWTTVKTVTADHDGATLLEVENITRSTRFYRIYMR